MNRRSFIFGALGLVAAPSIVRAASLMPVVLPKLPRDVIYNEWRDFERDRWIASAYERFADGQAVQISGWSECPTPAWLRRRIIKHAEDEVRAQLAAGNEYRLRVPFGCPLTFKAITG